MEKKLYRDENRKVIGGVCAGLAEYFSIDISVVRVVFAAALILKGVGLPLYIIMWAVLPKKPYLFNEPVVDYKVSPDWEPQAPFAKQPPLPRQRTGGLIVGLVMVMFGLFFLLNEFDYIPWISFHQFWPAILIMIGAAMIFAGEQKKHLAKQQFANNAGPVKESPVKEEINPEDPASENTSNI